MDGILAVTYRCNSRCIMCHTWKHQGNKDDELSVRYIEKMPEMVRLNITGGDPFMREDISDILHVVKKKAKRVVISSNGFFTKKILEVMSEHPDVGIRISLDGKPSIHDLIRGVSGGYQKATTTINGLKDLGVKDLGIAVTVSDINAGELVWLYRFAKENCIQLATAILHNAYYFHKTDNVILQKEFVEREIKSLISEYLKSRHPKDWFRAYFTNGIIEHMYGRQRTMKCTMATDSFFIDPYGDIRPCNVMDFPFGNIKDRTFNEIWQSSQAAKARKCVDSCTENCWMIGSVGHLMRRRFWIPLTWLAVNKLKSL